MVLALLLLPLVAALGVAVAMLTALVPEADVGWRSSLWSWQWLVCPRWRWRV